MRLGNTSKRSRQGVVYLTSDDSAAPFIDIVDNISYHSDWNTAGKIKARLGKLTGITDTDFGGALSGYGLYSHNVYLKGNIYATSGQFSGTVYASAGSFTGAVTATSAASQARLPRHGHNRRLDVGRNVTHSRQRRNDGWAGQRRHKSGVLCGQRHTRERTVSGDECGRIDGDQCHGFGEHQRNGWRCYLW